MPEPSPIRQPASESAPNAEERPLVEGEDFYREGPYVVFTEVYHLRRGYCCGSGCRHCPWRSRASSDAGGGDENGEQG